MKWPIILLACSLLSGCCSGYYVPDATPFDYFQSPAYQGIIAGSEYQNEQFLDRMAAQRR